MMIKAAHGVVALAVCAAAQNLTGTYMVTPQDIAVFSTTNNITAKEAQSAPFQIYHPDFDDIIGSSPSLQMIFQAEFPAFHEAGVVTSDNPLTLYSVSNQFNTTYASPATNNKTIVISRTVQNNITGSWSSEIIQNDTAPILLANGGFPYQNGVLFTVQGTKEDVYGAGLAYLPISPTPDNSTEGTLILNNYLGTPFNSPNDVYITTNGVIYFTDPPIGYFQNVRPNPQLPGQVYAFVPNSTSIRPVADYVGTPNGIQFNPDEKIAYVTDTTVAVFNTTELPGPNAIYAFDVTYPGSRGNTSYVPAPGEVAMFTNRRFFAQPAEGIPDGIKCDSQGNVYSGCADGINVWNPAGTLLGKIVVPGGTSNFGFASNGTLFAMNEDRLWLVQLNQTVQPAVAVGQHRG